MLSILLCQPIDLLVETKEEHQLPVRKKKKREESIEEGVFIDRRRPASIGD